MNELTMTASSHLLIGLLGITGFILGLVSIWKENQLRNPLSAIGWSALGIVCLCAMVLYANSMETLRAFEIVSHRVAAMMRQF
jgi:uncharacterized membrane protein